MSRRPTADGLAPSAPVNGDLDEAAYRGLADFRFHLRRFFAFSEKSTAAAGVAPAQYQAMLAIRAHPGPDRMTVSLLAEQLFIRVNSAVELVQRLQAAGLVDRMKSLSDRRRIELVLTLSGIAIVEQLARRHLIEHRERLADLEAFLQILAL